MYVRITHKNIPKDTIHIIRYEDYIQYYNACGYIKVADTEEQLNVYTKKMEINILYKNILNKYCI